MGSVDSYPAGPPGITGLSGTTGILVLSPITDDSTLMANLSKRTGSFFIVAPNIRMMCGLHDWISEHRMEALFPNTCGSTIEWTSMFGTIRDPSDQSLARSPLGVFLIPHAGSNPVIIARILILNGIEV